MLAISTKVFKLDHIYQIPGFVIQQAINFVLTSSNPPPAPVTDCSAILGFNNLGAPNDDGNNRKVKQKTQVKCRISGGLYRCEIVLALSLQQDLSSIQYILYSECNDQNLNSVTYLFEG